MGYSDFGKLAKEEADVIIVFAAEDNKKTVPTALTATKTTVSKQLDLESNNTSDRYREAVDCKQFTQIFRKEPADIKLKSSSAERKKRNITISRRQKTGFENIKENISRVYKEIDWKQEEKIGNNFISKKNPPKLQLLQLILPLDTLQDTRSTRKRGGVLFCFVTLTPPFATIKNT